MNWYHHFFKVASVETDLIERLDLSEPTDENAILCVFIFKTARKKEDSLTSLIPWKSIRSKEDLNNYIHTNLLEKVKNRFDIKKENDGTTNFIGSSYISVEQAIKIVDRDIEIIKFQLDPIQIQAIRTFIGNNNAESSQVVELLNLINKAKYNKFNDWWNTLNNNFSNYPAFIYIVMDYMTEAFNGEREAPPLMVDPKSVKQLFANTINMFKKNKHIANVEKLYSEIFDKNTNPDGILTQKTKEGGFWRTFSEATQENIDLLAHYGSLARWCICFDTSAQFYLQRGPVSIYFENGMPRVIVTARAPVSSFLVMPDGSRKPMEETTMEEKLNPDLQIVSTPTLDNNGRPMSQMINEHFAIPLPDKNGKLRYIADETRGFRNSDIELVNYWDVLQDFLKKSHLLSVENAAGYRETEEKVKQTHEIVAEIEEGNLSGYNSIDNSAFKAVIGDFFRHRLLKRIKNTVNGILAGQLSIESLPKLYTVRTGNFDFSIDEKEFIKEQLKRILDTENGKEAIKPIARSLPPYIQKFISDEIRQRAAIGLTAPGEQNSSSPMLNLEEEIASYTKKPTEEKLSLFLQHREQVEVILVKILTASPQFYRNPFFKKLVETINPNFLSDHEDVATAISGYSPPKKEKYFNPNRPQVKKPNQVSAQANGKIKKFNMKNYFSGLS